MDTEHFLDSKDMTLCFAKRILNPYGLSFD